MIQEIVNANCDHAIIDVAKNENGYRLTEEDKINQIAFHFSKIMNALGLDMNDDSLKGTPKRVAKMFVNEMFSGLNPNNEPAISLFENKYGYEKMLLEKDITLYSTCEHHFVPIIGKVHVAYIPQKKVIGLSKINRLVQFYAKRPQVQERLTMQICDALIDALGNNNVIVMIEADHLCVAARGIKDTKSKTVTVNYSGNFEDVALRQEFFSLIQSEK